MYPTPYKNSTLLPLLLLSLATQKHTPDSSKHIEREYDYIIVGAGSAGSVVASRLSEIPCVTVLLLEAGNPPPLLTEIPAIARSFVKTDIDWDYLTEPQKYAGFGLINRQVVWPSGKTIGGSSVLNARIAVRGNRKDYDGWEKLGAKGWSWKDIFPYFVRLENNTDPDKARNGYRAIGGPVAVGNAPYKPILQRAVFQAARSLGYPIVDPNGPSQIGFNGVQATIERGQSCSTAKAYLVPSEHRKNLNIVSGAFATKILFSGNTAVGVQFDHEGFRYQVKTRKEVILSAGTVRTPQLLLLSGIGPRRTLDHFHIPVVVDLPVGLNLQNHLSSVMLFVMNSIPPMDEKLVNPKNIKLYINKRVGPMASAEAVSSSAFLHNDPSDDPDRPPDHEIYFVEGSNFVPRTQINMKPSVYQQIFGPYENSTVLWCVASLLQPKSRGYVSIRSTNPYDDPVIDPRSLEHPDDAYSLASGLKSCLRIGETRPLKKLGVKPFETVIPGCETFLNNLDDYLECTARVYNFDAFNPVGTAKMGDPQDRTTVVDTELRVKGIKRLRVVDASVMPTVPSGNTNLPTIMIAEKASDVIKGSIHCY